MAYPNSEMPAVMLLIRTQVFKAVKISRDAQQRIHRCESQGLCLFCLQPISTDEQSVRGCHRKCDKAARRRVEAGKETEAEMVKSGKWGTTERTGRPAREPAELDPNGAAK